MNGVSDFILYLDIGIAFFILGMVGVLAYSKWKKKPIPKPD